MNTNNKTYRITKRFCKTAGFNALFVVALALLFVACDEWNETEEVSHVSHLPKFEVIGGEFSSFVVSSDTVEYEDPGAIAFSGNTELRVLTYGTVDLNTVGVYSILYYAENSDGFYTLGERIVAVTHKDVSENDLSGNYLGTLWSPLTEMHVEKVDEDGLYECSEVFGYPDAVVEGKFVDLGNHDLVLVHGDGDFGRYATTEGAYTLSALSWVIKLIDEPFDGQEITVSWVRDE